MRNGLLERNAKVINNIPPNDGGVLEKFAADPTVSTKLIVLNLIVSCNYFFKN